jgi:hypothetical protein
MASHLPNGYHVVTDQENDFAAIAAIVNGLFIPGWTMLETLDKASDGNAKRVVLIVKGLTRGIRIKPIAAGVVDEDNTVSIFVSEKKRRKGFGSIIAKRIHSEFPDAVGYAGVEGSDKFYQKTPILYGGDRG